MSKGYKNIQSNNMQSYDIQLLNALGSQLSGYKN